MFFGLKDATDSGDYQFLCLMIAINLDENVFKWFDNAVKDLNRELGNNVEKI